MSERQFEQCVSSGESDMNTREQSADLRQAKLDSLQEEGFWRWPRRPVAGAIAIYAALVAVVLERTTAVTSDLQLWADGSWIFIRVAATRGYYFWVGDWERYLFRSRFFSILANQTPLVVATHLPIHSLHALSLIFGITLYAHGLISLYICYRYAERRWYLLFPLLSFFAGTMNVEAFPIHDSHITVSLYWPILFILLFRRKLAGWTLVFLLGLSVPIVLSYESMLFFGVILAGVCFWRLKVFAEQKGLMVGLIAWYLLGAGLALASFIWPFDPVNKSGFIRGLIFLLHVNHLPAIISFLILFCCTLLLTIRPVILQNAIAAIGMAGVCYLFFDILIGKSPSSLEVEVPARVLNLIMPCTATALLVAVLVRWIKPTRSAMGLVALLIGALGLAQVFWNLEAIVRWQGMLATLRYELLLHQGPVPFEKSILASKQVGPLYLRELHGHWPLLALSLYASGPGEIRTMIMPEPDNYHPLDPFSVATWPDLSRYRVKYDLYREALKELLHYHLGDTLTFSLGGNAALFMRGAWADQEVSHTWSTGSEFGVDLPLSKDDLRGPVLLQAELTPNLAPNFPDLQVQVQVNDTLLGVWQFKYSPVPLTNKSVTIPQAVLSRDNPVRIRFHIVGPVRSPEEMGKGNDPRPLGLAFFSMKLESVQ
jgi:hypothetical protein